jgi:hypothetical protein
VLRYAGLLFLIGVDILDLVLAVEEQDEYTRDLRWAIFWLQFAVCCLWFAG